MSTLGLVQRVHNAFPLQFFLYFSYLLQKSKMPLMTRGNAREILANTLERFKTTTNEAVGVVFTWNSGLTVLGCNDFKEYVTENKEAVWAAVGMTKTDKYSLSK